MKYALNKKSLTLFALASICIATPIAAQNIVAPAGLASVEGNSGSSNLFGQINVSRFQQVFTAADFGTAPILLSGLAFRTNGVATGALFEGAGRAFSRTISDFSLTLSTTSRAPDGLSATFADNIGNDALAVIPRGSITFSSAAGSSNGLTRDFDVLFSFDNSFLFNPALGNLLLDATNFSGGNTSTSNGTPFDTQLVLGDGVSSLFRTNGTTGAGTLNTRGFITQFQVASAVPEPGTWAMMLIGFGAVGYSMRKRPGGGLSCRSGRTV